MFGTSAHFSWSTERSLFVLCMKILCVDREIPGICLKFVELKLPSVDGETTSRHMWVAILTPSSIVTSQLPGYASTVGTAFLHLLWIMIRFQIFPFIDVLRLQVLERADSVEWLTFPKYAASKIDYSRTFPHWVIISYTQKYCPKHIIISSCIWFGQVIHSLCYNRASIVQLCHHD